MTSQSESENVPDHAALVAEARAAILSAGPMLAPAEVAALLGETWPSRGLNLIALPLESGGVGFPAFQFDAEAGMVRAIVLEINDLLGARQDPWGAASFWTQPDARLEARPPADLLGTAHEPDLRVMVQDDVAGW
jgi:hypothetical protein